MPSLSFTPSSTTTDTAAGLPLGRVALAAEPSWVPGFVLLGLAVALFPDGRLASRRWRIPMIVYVTAGVWFCCVWSLSLATLHVGAGFDVDEVGNYSGDPGRFSGAVAGIAWAASPIVLLLLIAFVIRQAATWRRATEERRKQLTWLMSGGALSVVSIYLVSTNNTSSAGRVITDIAAVGLTGIPLAIGVGILKYRLYDIDRLISRTLSYLVITGLLAAVFLGLVALTTSVLPFSSPVGIAASTLVAAGLFTPLRGRVQRAVDRRFNRARYDADAIIAAFTIRLRDAIDLDTISQELRHVVNQAVAPAHASVWITPTATPSRATRRHRLIRGSEVEFSFETVQQDAFEFRASQVSTDLHRPDGRPRPARCGASRWMYVSFGDDPARGDRALATRSRGAVPTS